MPPFQNGPLVHLHLLELQDSVSENTFSYRKQCQKLKAEFRAKLKLGPNQSSSPLVFGYSFFFLRFPLVAIPASAPEPMDESGSGGPTL